MNIVGELVQHSKYGFGRVVNQTEHTVKIEFYTDQIQKEFPFPSVFRQQLSLSDPLAQSDLEYEMSHPHKQPTNSYFDF